MGVGYMDHIETYVYESKDYGMFKAMKGNRSLNQGNLNNIENSVKIIQYIIPIIVNEFFQIIDGQHRFWVFRKLKLPIYYIKIKGLRLKDCITLNSFQRIWTPENFLESYCKQDFPEYLKFRDFKEEYKFMSMKTCQIILSGHTNESVMRNDFKNGTFKIKNFERSYLTCSLIKDFSNYEPFKLAYFQLALVDVIENKDYNHKKMLIKAKIQKRRLTRELTKIDYLKSLTEIYNYRSRTKTITF
jgi:hypothetical protein